MKYCIVPDVHGRDFWKEIKNKIDKYEKVIFLGDYVDPYVTYDKISQEEAFDNFIEVLEFARGHKDKVTLLLGNHDLHYFPNISERWGCRRDDERYKEIQGLFLKNIDLFQLCEVIETKIYGKILLTHAGVNKGWLNHIAYDIIGINDNWVDEINALAKDFTLLNKYVWTIGPMRGGMDLSGSLVWSDLHEHGEESTGEVNTKLGVDYQIFAHTYSNEIYETPSFSMIDNKELFEVN